MNKILVAIALLAISGVADAQQVRMVGDLPRREGRPLQALAGLETEYGLVRTSEGVRLRTILTRPAGTPDALPAILLAQWVSCGSLDFAANASNLLRDIAEQSGMVLIRLERSGTGDSEGAPCSALDYDTEVRHYREAFDQFARHPWVDPQRIIIFGSSLGATTAPLIAQGRNVAGIVVQGGGALTYLERMIHFDRIFLERSGKYSPTAIHEEMARRIRFHTEYLLGRRTPAEVERANSDLAGTWQTIRGGAEAPPHYGRPHAWHWQAAAHDFLEAWTKVQAPVLVVYGEYDQFETRHGHALIAETVNRLRPGSATFVEIPRADHEIEVYATPEDAYAYRNGGPRSPLFLTTLLDWARRITAKPSPSPMMRSDRRSR
jgi:pimeloyl-ACP methyl ester carboxylesterase